LFDQLRAAGIGANVHYIPVPSQPYYQDLGFDINLFPNANDYYSRIISLPIYPNLSESDQDFVVAVLEKFFS